MLAIKLENSTASVSADAERILRSLPRWFGIESSLLEYVNDTVSLPTFTATEDSKIIAFLSLKKHASHAWEVSCLAVQADRRHLGIGRLLHEHVESWLIEQGARFLQVKTVGEAHPSSEYAQTRAFYKALGYCELETFAELWGAGLPVLQFLKALAHKS